MSEALTTYTVTGKTNGFLWEFKYDLNGFLRAFKILEGNLSGKQMKWLFSGCNFPASELLMKTMWINNKEVNKHINVEIGEPDLSFDLFYNNYNHKIKKVPSKKVWKRLSKRDKMAAIAYIKTYDNYLARKSVSKANPQAYLNQRYWEDNHASIH